MSVHEVSIRAWVWLDRVGVGSFKGSLCSFLCIFFWGGMLAVSKDPMYFFLGGDNPKP